MKTKQIPDHHQKRLNLLGTYVRELRLNENMTQMEVGAESEIHFSTVKRVEGKMNFTLTTLFEISDFYGLQPSELLSILD